MGVTGLWQVLQPVARPTKLETLNKKRLAVDASIWIYQFLKAVRDKEGNALRNSHVVGFFRRICKLLFFGIRPVFVFDGGAPALKRQTISARKARREGRREDAVRTAGKLLAIQMQRRAEEDERRRKEEREMGGRPRPQEELPEDALYVEEIGMTEQQRRQNRTSFKKKDAYHLPDMDVDLAAMGAPNDPRIMSQEELEEYARQFHTGEDINLYDFSKIDFESPFFQSLPASDRYNILNAARLRSRLRMGYSKEQLDVMFPDRMAFSKFQIERVKERNELTQRLMNLNGMNGDEFSSINGRVAGEKGKEYVLVKNDGVEGGWALGVVSNRNEGGRNQPIDVEGLGKEIKTQEGDWEDDEGFEDVPIEGLNRLPKPPNPNKLGSTEDLKQREAFYQKRRQAPSAQGTAPSRVLEEDPESLFVPDIPNDKDEDDNMEDLFEEVLPQPQTSQEDDDLQQAIAMSLEQPDDENDDKTERRLHAAMLNGPSIDQPLDFNQRNAGAGRAFAHLSNGRANGEVSGPFINDSDDSDTELQEALAESKEHLSPREMPASPGWGTARNLSATANKSPKKSQSHGFDGPLPFESLNLGTSILGRKKKHLEEEGGFEKEAAIEAQPLPPWFSADVREGNDAQKALDDRQFDGASSDNQRQPQKQPILRKHQTNEVIDVDAPKQTQEIIDVDSSDDEDDVVMENVRPIRKATSDPAKALDGELQMNDIADLARADPPKSGLDGDGSQLVVSEEAQAAGHEESAKEAATDEEIEWSESEPEDDRRQRLNTSEVAKPAYGEGLRDSSKSSSPELEDVKIPEAQPAQMERQSPPPLPQDDTFDRMPANETPLDEDDDIYSDPEDEELMRQLAVEAEEHARFAATLNTNAHPQSGADYERELRQLRNQQKKDRRDADEVTQIMITECQQLLKLFGLPYVTAPMEAEAQCAELVRLGLVDGVVTDDSDIFLFGGTRVYKNMFNQAKFVECYLASDLEKEYALTRAKIIQIAQLLGSDYTEGLPSVGPVTALEILSEFEHLEAFRDWWTSVQSGGRAPEHDATNPFRRKFRRSNATKLFLPPSFPDPRVDTAYLHPDVDADPSPFAWGVPALDALRGFLMATVGWSQARVDEILVPVIRDMNRREAEGTQANITHFFSGAVGAGAREGYAPRRKGEGRSRRMESALGRLKEKGKRVDQEGGREGEGGDEGEGEMEQNGAGARQDLTPDGREQRPVGRKTKGQNKRPAAERGASSDLGSESEDSAFAVPRKAAKRKTTRRRKT